MAVKDDESAGMGSHPDVLINLEVEHLRAAVADALAYEALTRVAVTWARILDCFVYSTREQLIRRHTTFTRVSHAMILPSLARRRVVPALLKAVHVVLDLQR